jgi:putative hydrolase of the HAD superfamily
MSDRALVFDLDDTLYPERQYVRSGYRVVAEVLRERLGTSVRYEDWLWDRFQAGRSDGALDALRIEYQLDLKPKDIADLVETYRNHHPQLQPRDGMVPLLTSAGKQAHLAILSDGFLPAQQYKLEALRLRSFFQQVVFTETLGRAFWKPAAEGFQLIRELLGVAHEDCVYIGDNPAKDFVAPNLLGWKTIQLRLEDQVHAREPEAPNGKPDCTCLSVGELSRVLLG